MIFYMCKVLFIYQLTTSSSSGSVVVDVSVIWSGPGVDPPHEIDTLNDSNGKSLFSFMFESLMKVSLKCT